MKYAIIGNPNCGKSTIFNALTGQNQKIGNWNGVTVDKKIGIFSYNQKKIEIVDLPGIYSLTTSNQIAIDENIACRFIIESKPKAIINVIDASNLERNLYLTMQLFEMNIPIILVLNMMDVAYKKGMTIDSDKLSKITGCSVIPLIARKKIGIIELKKILSNMKVNTPFFNLKKYYHSEVQAFASSISKLYKTNSSLWLATSIIEKNYISYNLFTAQFLKSLKNLKIKYVTEKNLEILLANDRYKASHDIVRKITLNQRLVKDKITEIIDSFCMHKYLGIIIFLLIMYFLFEFSINIGGSLQPFCENISNFIFIDCINYLGIYFKLPIWFTKIITQGIGLGITTVLTFIPQISCLFLFLSFLEDSGYMARAAFVMDKLMQTIGLPGKAFVPLIIGFGCNVPSVMATRTLDDPQDRLISIMMAPFISCGARLTIFSVFATAFFPRNGSVIIFSLYIIGIIGAVLTGYMIKFIFLQGKSMPFIMELPVYHLPNFSAIAQNTYKRAKDFIIKAGKVIVPICLIIGALNSIENNGNIIEGGSKNSILALIGKMITPVFHPIGIKSENWPATVGLLTGSLAKEVVIGTLNTLYTQNSQYSNKLLNLQSIHILNNEDIIKNVQFQSKNNNYRFIKSITNSTYNKMGSSAMGSMIISFSSIASVFSYMIFILLYIPCVSVIAIMAKEATRYWAILSIFWSLSIAYTISTISYQLTCIGRNITTSLFWIIGLSCYIFLLTIAMKFIIYKLRFTIKSQCINSCCCTKKISLI